MESGTAKRIPLLITHFAKIMTIPCEGSHTQRDNEKEGIASSIFRALYSSLIFFRSRTCRPLQLC
jgi:hypothetical protein